MTGRRGKAVATEHLLFTGEIVDAAGHCGSGWSTSCCPRTLDASSDPAEGVAAFAERRPARFTWQG